MATIHKLTKDGATIFPATITDAVVHPQTGKTLTSMIKDYNVSELFPTEGIDGGNKYNLALAVQVLGTHLRASEKTGGIKLTFISSVSDYEEEYYLSKNVWSAVAADWKQRFEVGDVVADPVGDWDPSTAEQYIDQQIATEAATRLAQDTYIQSQIPLVDEEDLTKSGSYLKFKDRTYNQVSPNGMGKVILRNNIVNGVNTLTQNMIDQTNTIYVIRYDFDLASATITIPKNCILDFQGGCLSNGTLNPNGCYINGYKGFDKTLVWSNTVDCNVSNDAIEIDWWKTEKVTLSQYRAFIADGQLTGPIPTITDTNRTILQNIPKWTLDRNGIKFGKGIYPFDNYVDMMGDSRIFGEDEHSTLLWAPQSDLLHYSGGFEPSIKNLSLEANGKVFFTSGASYLGLHRPSIENSTLISYNDNCVQCGNDDGTQRNAPYGGFFHNLKVYGGPGKSAFRQFGSNSMVYNNVVDAHRFYSNSANTNARGMMFSFFYNCNFQECRNANVTYSGFKYFYYIGNEDYAITLMICRIYNSTFEGGSQDFALMANIIKVMKQQTSINLVMKDITYISNNFEYNSPIWIDKGSSVSYLDINTNLVFLNSRSLGKVSNASNHTIYAVQKSNKYIYKITHLKERTKGYVKTDPNYHTCSYFNINNIEDYVYMPEEVKQCAADAEFGTGEYFYVYMNAGEKCIDDCSNQFVQGATAAAWKTIYTNESIDKRILKANDIGTGILYNGKPLVYDGINFVDGVGAAVLYDVTYNLENLYSSNNRIAANGTNYFFRLLPASGYALPSSITITMGGVTLTAGTDYTYDSSTGTTNILGTGGSGGVTGVVVISATGTSV